MDNTSPMSISEHIIVRGGNRLSGRIPASGAKNAALPLMTACLLTDEPLILNNCPDLADIATLSALLEGHGTVVDHDRKAQCLSLHAKDLTSTVAPYELVSSMRASFLVIGPLLARARKATVALPGGCAIGARPVDLHMKALEQMGAKLVLDGGDVIANAPDGLQGAVITFPMVSVGATENILMAATLANGRTELINAAKEPEVTDLAECLIAMGAKISGVGTGHLIIDGVDRLHGTTHTVVADRIEAGTFAMIAGITGGDLLIENARLEHLSAARAVLAKAGVQLTAEGNGFRATRTNGLTGVDVTTEPHPDFPTDLQAQYMALMTVADGASLITENVFENRFMHVPEFQRLGADIAVTGRSAMVRGVTKLTGAEVQGTDLRASAAMVMAGLVASGETHVHGLHYLDRGYDGLEAKLRAVGADIDRVSS